MGSADERLYAFYDPPTPTPTTTINYVNLAVNPTNVNLGAVVGISWSCDFSYWNYQGVPVDIYLAAIRSPRVVNVPSSIADALNAEEVYLFENGIKKAYRYTGKVKKPTWRNVKFPPTALSGTLNFVTPASSYYADDWVFATAFFRKDVPRPVRTDAPVEISNLFHLR